MFTGLIETVGQIASITGSDNGVRLAVESDLPVHELELGESVAVNGCCLTVTRTEGRAFHADVSRESLERTNLGSLVRGDRVNLERAMRLGDRLGGHLVLGHVDGRGRVSAKEPVGEATKVTIEAPTELMPYLVEKGSVAVDGISLTVNGIGATWFDLMIVPFTATKVTILDRGPGWITNLEVDILGKYVARLLSTGRLPEPLSLGLPGGAAARSGLSLDKLRDHGFAD